MKPEDFLSLLLPAAQACQREFGVPASITLAQAAQETGWGSRVKANNLFGVKADSSWNGPVAVFVTHEHEGGKDVEITAKFRLYKSWGDSIRDHAQFLQQNDRYKPCFREPTAAGFARALQAAGYATDPHYADALIAIINGRNLTRFDQLIGAAK
jgi:flagellar protein FlgJ